MSAAAVPAGRVSPAAAFLHGGLREEEERMQVRRPNVEFIHVVSRRKTPFVFTIFLHLKINQIKTKVPEEMPLTSILKSSRRLNLHRYSCSLGSISKVLALEYLRKAQNFSSPYSWPEVGRKQQKH